MVVLLVSIVLLFINFSIVTAGNGHSLEGLILLGDDKLIRAYDTSGKQLEVVANKGAQSIDYDCSTKEMVWSDWDTYEVYIQGDKLATLPKPEGQWIPISVAVDSINHKIYVAENLATSVILYDRRNNERAVIYKVDRRTVYSTWQLAVDPNEGYLFIQSDYEITRTDLKGANPKVIYFEIEEGPNHESELMNMTRFTIDTQSKLLFWLNDKTGQVWNMDYEGKNSKVVFERHRENEMHSFDSLTVVDGTLYWADSFKNKLIKVALNSPWNGRPQSSIHDLLSVEPQSIKAVKC